MRKGVWIIIAILLLAIATANAKLISLEPDCGETNLYEQGQGGNAEWVMENDCIKLEMKKNNYDPNTEIYDKHNDRQFRLMANQLEERNNVGSGTSTTTLTSMNLDSDIDDGYIRWTDNNGFMLGYSLTGRGIKFVGNITGWTYNYADSDLWLDIRYHKNEGDTLTWIPVIIDGVEQPIVTENRTAGQNTFISQKLGRGYEIIIDPIYTVDATPQPATLYTNGEDKQNNYSSYASSSDITTIMSDNNTGTSANMNHNPAYYLDNVIRVRYNITPLLGADYFLRVYRPFSTTHTQVVYPAINSTHINLSSNSSKVISGTGWHNIPVTDQVMMSYDDNGYVDLRLSVLTNNQVTVSEVWLREGVNDTSTPTISSCYFDEEVVGCYETTRIICNVTDDSDVENVTFYLEEDEELHILTGYMNVTQWFTNYTHNETTTHNGTLVNVTACDIFNQCVTEPQNITYQYNCSAVCVENWIAQYEDLEDCQTNNTQSKKKTYIDSNSCGTTTELPVDNGSIADYYCNYCDSGWAELTGGIHECQLNETRYVEYFDYNYCYILTNLTEDEPPYDDMTWIDCEYYQSDFNCSISDIPYIRDKMEYTCQLPSGSVFECINTVSFGFDDILQVNPQKTERTQGGLITIKGDLESRESFTTNNGILNAYFTKKNLVAETSFTITTTCSSENQTLIHQQSITPKIKDIDRTPTWLLWGKDNATYIVILILLLIVVSLIIGSLWYNAKGSYR